MAPRFLLGRRLEAEELGVVMQGAVGGHLVVFGALQMRNDHGIAEVSAGKGFEQLGTLIQEGLHAAAAGMRNGLVELV